LPSLIHCSAVPGWLEKRTTACAKEGPRQTPGEDPRARWAMTDNGSHVIYAHYTLRESLGYAYLAQGRYP
jgi:hypothetical protein